MQLKFIALTSIGVESLLADELTSFGAIVSKQTVGSVQFDAEFALAQEICLRSFFATRIMMEIATAEEINDKDALYKATKSVAWDDYFSQLQSFLVDFSGTNKALINTQFSALVVKDAVVDYFYEKTGERPNVSKENPDIRIVARLHRGKVNIFLDFSGPSLSKRGYRLDQGKAPIKEHLAAALVKRSGWLQDPSKPLFDPCCGSGTLLFEAGIMASNIAPGLFRSRFAFESLPGFRRIKFKELKDKLRAEETSPSLYLIGHDNDERTLQKARQNAERLPFAKFIRLQNADANKLTAVAKFPGTVISNLPYGERLGETAQLVSLYRNLGSAFKKHFKNWQLALFSTDESLLSLFKLVKQKQYKFKNGPLDCLLTTYLLDERNCASSKEHSLHFENSLSFANRLKKNQASLKSWVEQNAISCYRIYDADIPEYNVAVDRYNEKLVIYEYAPPKNVDAIAAEKRLQDMIYLASETLQIDSNDIVVKTRKKQKGKEQYQALNKQNKTMIVEEFGAKFVVNLHDYLDTGLFLDHRLARRYIQQNAKDKRVLNLFAYTGSASVHAALGGAKSVTTLDMSKTYLNWARDNFALNDFSGRRYHFEQADCLNWLEHAQGQFDLIFLDPPTFSNSKRMKDAFDVQRDHLKLFGWVKKILAPGGTLLFSNNKRGFKMDFDGLAALGLVATNISDETLSPDFKRNKQIHNSWLIRYA